MEVFLFFVFGLYIIFLLSLLLGWEKTLAEPSPESHLHPNPISVIIPFRNERNNIEKLIQSLLNQNYSKDKLQIFLINDHSTDYAVDLIQQFAHPNIQLINLEEEETGKKAAITKGILMASSDIIVTTDADCVHQRDWLQTVNTFFYNQTTQMVVGPVSIHQTNSVFAKLQALEFSSLIGSGAALLQWNIPAMANGANLAFRKEAFHQVSGYEGNEHIASGDDEFLMRKIFKAYPDGVIFNNQQNSVVFTLPQFNLKGFFNQRIRWAGKWKHQTNLKVKATAATVFMFQVSFVAALAMAIGQHQKLATILLLAKAGLEGIFLFRVCQFLKVKFSIIPFALLQFIYPVYVVFIAIASLFIKSIWKGRKS